MDVSKWIDDRIIFMGIAGSHAYGLNTPESDIDYRGVCIPPMNYFTGLRQFEQKDSGWGEGVDKVVYSISKFVQLASKCNPNIIEQLWLPDDCIIKSTPLWERLVGIRDEFLTKQARHTYSGYAYSQIKRIQSHRAWLISPPSHEPTREEFGLTDKRMGKEFYGVLDTLQGTNFETVFAGIPDGAEGAIWQTFEQERRWKSARRTWEQYINWKNTRNPVRFELEKKFGFDCKHASHCVRLMLQGLDILQGKFTSARLNPEQRELCMGIKNGMWTFDELMSNVTDYLHDFDEAYEVSTLPKSANLDKIESVLSDIILEGNSTGIH
jgi:hypothetical protein